MADLFSTDTLSAIVEDLRTPANGLAGRYFTSVQTADTEEIHFDVDSKPRRMSPFVSPLVGGKVVRSRGFAAKTFKPAYIKDKRVFHPGRAIKRAMGERVGGGQYSPDERLQLLVAQDLQDQLDMLERRIEWMAAQAMHSGAVTITGEDYPTVVVDFGRDAALTVVKTGANRWGQAGINPLDDLQDWSDTMVQKTGVAMTEVAMTVDVWKIFRADANVKARLDRWRGNSTMQTDAHQREGLVFQGMVDQFAVYTYSGWVVDPVTDTEGAILPAGTVVGAAGPAYVEGTRHFGAILDVDSLQAVEYFTKSWIEQDPSLRYLLMQSAPLLVPERVNATFRATVL
ncbi:MAG: major capsid protein [Zoogloea sp.]|nr:major capsid protein [Zoogloea sp.]